MYAMWDESLKRFKFAVFNNGGVKISSAQHQELLQAESNGKILKPDAAGNPIAADPTPPSLDTFATLKISEIEAARDAAINAGFTHTFKDKEDVVQTRQRDRENLTGLAVSAQRQPDKTFHFRAESNTTYELSSYEILALADAAQAHVSQQYARSWQLKAELDAAHKAKDRKAIVAINW